MGGLLALLTGVLPGILDKLIPDEAARAKAQMEIQQQLLEAAERGDLAQIEVNKAEAANASVFVSGWRPAVGWLCMIALLWKYVIGPTAEWACAIWAPGVTLPQIDTSELIPLLLGMLGLGSLRTFEKMRGVGTMSLGEQPAPAPKIAPGASHR